MEAVVGQPTTFIPTTTGRLTFTAIDTHGSSAKRRKTEGNSCGRRPGDSPEGLSASTSQVAKISGIAEGSLFTYFVNKNDDNT
jgi:hypothetical protein